MKINKYLKESGLLTKGVTDIIKNEGKEQKGGFIGILLGTFGASLDATLHKVVTRAVKDTSEQVKEQLEQARILMRLLPLTNFEIQTCSQNKPNLMVFIQEPIYLK